MKVNRLPVISFEVQKTGKEHLFFDITIRVI